MSDSSSWNLCLPSWLLWTIECSKRVALGHLKLDSKNWRFPVGISESSFLGCALTKASCHAVKSPSHVERPCTGTLVDCSSWALSQQAASIASCVRKPEQPSGKMTVDNSAPQSLPNGADPANPLNVMDNTLFQASEVCHAAIGNWNTYITQQGGKSRRRRHGVQDVRPTAIDGSRVRAVQQSWRTMVTSGMGEWGFQDREL